MTGTLKLTHKAIGAEVRRGAYIAEETVEGDVRHVAPQDSTEDSSPSVRPATGHSCHPAVNSALDH